mmetsp:Transcript_99706/g.321199  ORF Transcript_99706/g.321199 Transcript_99706/m.321199 type:complete len:400 (+) Transcript_99706:339-1538(+)
MSNADLKQPPSAPPSAHSSRSQGRAAGHAGTRARECPPARTRCCSRRSSAGPSSQSSWGHHVNSVQASGPMAPTRSPARRPRCRCPRCPPRRAGASRGAPEVLGQRPTGLLRGPPSFLPQLGTHAPAPAPQLGAHALAHSLANLAMQHFPGRTHSSLPQQHRENLAAPLPPPFQQAAPSHPAQLQRRGPPLPCHRQNRDFQGSYSLRRQARRHQSRQKHALRWDRQEFSPGPLPPGPLPTHHQNLDRHVRSLESWKAPEQRLPARRLRSPPLTCRPASQQAGPRPTPGWSALDRRNAGKRPPGPSAVQVPPDRTTSCFSSAASSWPSSQAPGWARTPPTIPLQARMPLRPERAHQPAPPALVCGPRRWPPCVLLGAGESDWFSPSPPRSRLVLRCAAGV